MPTRVAGRGGVGRTARLPGSARHIVAHVPNTPNRLSEIRYSICKVPPEALERIAAHDEYFYFDVPELV